VEEAMPKSRLVTSTRGETLCSVAVMLARSGPDLASRQSTQQA